MISRLRGALIAKQAPFIIIEAAGVGYQLQVPMTTFYKLPELDKEIILHTHLIMREDSLNLYGFLTQAELDLFKVLIKVTGIGPKLAINILSGIEPNNLIEAVINGDLTNLTGLPGIGKKTAQRLLLEMRDYLKDWNLDNHASSVVSGTSSPQQDALSALVTLGYKQQEANRALNKYREKNLTSEELIRKVLKDMHNN